MEGEKVSKAICLTIPEEPSPLICYCLHPHIGYLLRLFLNPGNFSWPRAQGQEGEERRKQTTKEENRKLFFFNDINQAREKTSCPRRPGYSYIQS